MSAPRIAEVPTERASAWENVGWKFVRFVGGYGEVRALLRWEGDGEPVLPLAPEPKLSTAGVDAALIRAQTP